MNMARARNGLKAFFKELINGGNYKLPQPMYNEGNKFIPEFALNHEGVAISVIRSDEDKEVAKQFMIKTFYNSGLVPKALRLGDIAVRKLDSIPYHEVDMMLNSGVSLIMRDIQSKEIASVSLNTLWPVDPNHDFKQIDPLEWLNVAAEVAQEDFEHHDDVICAWRFLQYQLLYHLFNMEAVKLGKRFILYSGMQHVEEQYRNVGLSKMQVQNFLDAFPKDGYFGMMGTFPRFKDVWRLLYLPILNDLGYVAYKDIKLMADGRKVFAVNANLAGLTFMGTKF